MRDQCGSDDAPRNGEGSPLRVSSRAVLAIAAAGASLTLASVTAGTASATEHAAVAAPASATYSTTGALTGVAAASESNSWAVGYAGGGTAPTKVLMLHWNGRNWSRVTSPKVLTGPGELAAVTVVSASDAWAVGNTGSDLHPHTLILHWNGAAWSEVTSPAPVTDASLSAVTANATGGWAVGYYSTGPAAIQTAPLIFQLTGTTWSQSDPSFGSGTGVAMDGVATTSAGDTFATGLFTGMITGVLASWSGSSWSWVSSFPEAGTYHWLNAIAAGPDGNAFAVGLNTGSAPSRVISIEWNGHSWVKAPAPSWANLYTVAFAPGGAAWAAGDRYPGGSVRTTRMMIFRWNGHAWSSVTAPATTAQPASLGFATARYGWVVGRIFTDSGHSKTFIARWNGHAWS